MFFEVGSYKVHIYSRSVPYRADQRSPDAQLCSAVNGVQMQNKF